MNLFITSGTPRLVRVVAAVVVLVSSWVGGVMVLGASGVHAQTPIPAATPDTFYDAPRTVPTEPGMLLRSEPFTRDVPADARAWEDA